MSGGSQMVMNEADRFDDSMIDGNE